MIQENQVKNVRRCPACDSDAARPAGQKNGIPLLRCRNCASLYAAILPNSPAMDVYAAYYDESNLSAPDVVHRQLTEIVSRFASFRQTNRLLDIGCGSGLLLEAARDAGWEVTGVEISRPAVEHIRKRGFSVFSGELVEADYPAGSFDVVVASELLEHVPDPRSMIAEAARILRDGGLFWATTPHGQGASARVLGTEWSVVCPPEHLHLFSLPGVRNLLKANGFTRPQIVTHGLNPFEILNAMRRRKPAQQNNGVGGFQRVQSSYRLNEKLTKNHFNRAVKAMLNETLALTRMGDSLKIWAVK